MPDRLDHERPHLDVDAGVQRPQRRPPTGQRQLIPFVEQVHGRLTGRCAGPCQPILLGLDAP